MTHEEDGRGKKVPREEGVFEQGKREREKGKRKGEENCRIGKGNEFKSKTSKTFEIWKFRAVSEMAVKRSR